MTRRRAQAPIILVGLPGAGKTTVGRLVATALGWDYVDLDEAIERAAGRGIPEIFREDGELAFRALEREATLALVGRDRLVIAPGGGWMSNEDCPDLLRPPGRIIHLRVGVDAALERLRQDTVVRPLLAYVAEPREYLALLAARRAPDYARADFELDAEALSPQQVAGEVVRLATTGGAG